MKKIHVNVLAMLISACAIGMCIAHDWVLAGIVNVLALILNTRLFLHNASSRDVR